MSFNTITKLSAILRRLTYNHFSDMFKPLRFTFTAFSPKLPIR
nr:MAG TPA: hypothetical protein [Caudoviricetes sp.]DAM00955.1 MAG TPA: hypothetical protein [Caudoviricetes sp.]